MESMPKIDGIEYVWPRTDRFRLNWPNLFWFKGQGLANQTVTSLKGVLDDSNLTISWSGTLTVWNLIPDRLLVLSTPSLAFFAEEERSAANPGTVTPTLGGTPIPDVPANYET